MTKRRTQPPILDLATDQREWVCLRVAAEYLELDERSVKARIDDGRLDAFQDDKVYRISLAALRVYERRYRRGVPRPTAASA